VEESQGILEVHLMATTAQEQLTQLSEEALQTAPVDSSKAEETLETIEELDDRRGAIVWIAGAFLLAAFLLADLIAALFR
jgi:hypothetical protein